MGKTKTNTPEKEAGTDAMTAAMIALNPFATTAWTDILTESTRFVSDRLQQDLEAQRAILACRTPDELMDVQAKFFKEAMTQYLDEATRLYEMMSKATEDTLKDTHFGTARRYDDVPV